MLIDFNFLINPDSIPVSMITHRGRSHNSHIGQKHDNEQLLFEQQEIIEQKYYDHYYYILLLNDLFLFSS